MISDTENITVLSKVKKMISDTENITVLSTVTT